MSVRDPDSKGQMGEQVDRSSGRRISRGARKIGKRSGKCASATTDARRRNADHGIVPRQTGEVEGCIGASPVRAQDFLSHHIDC